MPPSADNVQGSPSVEMVDLFAGPGGFDVAAHWFGIFAEGIEWDENACHTRSRAGLLTRIGDVRQFSPADYPGGRFLAGGPPCQTFTVAGRGAGRAALETVLKLVKRMGVGDDIRAEVRTLGDERTGLVLEPLRWAITAHKSGAPYESIVLEQVPAVLPVWLAIAEVLDGFGYGVACDMLRTEEFGVPQTRRRAVLVARLDATVQLPSPTHDRFVRGGKNVEESGLLKWTSMGDALRCRPQPFSVISNYGSGGDPQNRGRRTSGEPAATITGKVSRNRIVHESRELARFSASEAGILQSFPRDYPWSAGDWAQQVGNALPPRLAAHLIAAARGQTVSTERLDTAVKASWLDPNGFGILAK